MNIALAFENKISLARRALFVWRFRHQERLSRFALGMAYALGHQLTDADRHALRVKMNEALGYYPLMTLATEDVLQNAMDVYGEKEAAKLKPYLDAACDHVARKWDNGCDVFGLAVDWALENALAYAEADGIVPKQPL